MKKIALLIVLMMVIALTSYAADIAVTVTGSSELVFGVNLNDPLATGFTNTNVAEIDFTLVSGDSEKGKAEDGAVYGYIKVSGWSMAADNGVWKGADNGDVEAKIIFPSGWVKISGTNADLNYINVVQDDDSDNDNADKGLNDALAKSGGFVLGLNFAPIAIELGVFSENDWTEDAAVAGDDLNDEHAYGVNLKATVDVAPIKIEAGAEMGLNHSDETIGAGAKITATLTPLTVYAGLDVKANEPAPEEVIMEFAFGASVAVAGITVSADGSYNEFLDGFDLRAKVDASGLVANLGLTLTVELFNMDGFVVANDPAIADSLEDLEDGAEYAVILALSYALPTVKPYANVRYGTFTHDDDNDDYTYTAEDDYVLSLSVGAEMTMIPNVKFTLEYASDDLTDDANDLGKIYFKTKIAL